MSDFTDPDFEDGWTSTTDRRAERVERELAALKRAHVALAEQAGKDQAAIARVRAELDRIANLRTITHDDGHADTFSTGVRWAIRIIRENVLGEQADRTPPVHIGNRVNAEDCPGCSGTNPPYPFICPAQPGDPGGPYPTA